MSDNPAPVTIPSCIGGDSGIKAGVQNEIDARVPDVIRIPIFDGPCTAPNCKEGFHVVDFGCVTNQGWVKKLQLTNKIDGAKGWFGKVIKVTVSCDRTACASDCGSTTGGGCSGGSQVCAVSLLK